jgi:uncharacterized membrane protein YeaQ/YmgE (transglycosylase-associated protein family)
MPGKSPRWILVNIVIGIAGSLVASFLGRAIGWYQESQSEGFIMSFAKAQLSLTVPP